MKRIKIQRMKISNFKGIHALDVTFDGKDMLISGANGSGKTTIMDAFCWALWGKDSHGNSDFDIKPIVNGEPMHKAEHEVEVVLSVNEDRSVALRRVFTEKWTKPRGQLEYVFTGHETKYYIDDEPITAGKYKAEVETLMNEKIFQALSNPLYFNEKLSWQQRRNILVDICGKIDPSVIVGDDPLLKSLGVIDDREIEKKRKIAADKASKIRKEIESLPYRIAELQRTIPADADMNVEAIQKEIEIVEQGIDEGTAAIKEASAQLAKEEQDLRAKITHEEEAGRIAYEKAVASQTEERNALWEQEAKIKTERSGKENNLTSAKNNVFFLQQTRERLLSKYTDASNAMFTEPEIATDCPTCGRRLEEKEIEALQSAREQRRLAFEETKKTKLAEIINEGKSVAKQIASSEASVVTLTAEIKALNEQLKEVEAKVAAIVLPPYNPPQKILNLKHELAVLLDSHSNLGNYSNVQQEALTELRQKWNELKSKLAKAEVAQATTLRLTELQNAESDLNQQHEEQRRIMYACETYTRRRMDIISSTLNSKFKLAKWTLFKRNITNDGIEECCEVSLHDVPYKNINSAGVINVGMDIIETLIKYYDCSVPIFIDNAESVTDLNRIGGEAQIIRLFVDGNVPKLSFIND